MQRGLKKAFCVFHKLCSSLGEAVSPRAPFAPCLAPTYPDGRTWFLCCFSSTGICLFVTQLFCTTEGTDILGEWSGKFHSFCCLENEPVTLLFFAEPGTVFCSFCISTFPCFSPCPNLYAFKTSCTRCDCRVVIMLQEERFYAFPLPQTFQEPGHSLC